MLFLYISWLRSLILSTLTLLFSRFLPAQELPPTSLRGKHALVTGANSGIGLAISHALAARGAHITLACRSITKGREAAAKIRSELPEASIAVVELDISSFSSIRLFVRSLATRASIDLLYLNAGTPGSSGEPSFTEDGFETIYATNFLGSFFLLHLIEANLSVSARVIFTSAIGHYAAKLSARFSLRRIRNHLEPGFHYRPLTRASPSARYANTKLMQAACALALQRRWIEMSHEAEINQRMAFAFSPGFVRTPIFNSNSAGSIFIDPVFWLLKISQFLAIEPQDAAATAVWLGVVPRNQIEPDSKSSKGLLGLGAFMGRDKSLGGLGGYFDRMTQRTSGADLLSNYDLDRLWTDELSAPTVTLRGQLMTLRNEVMHLQHNCNALYHNNAHLKADNDRIKAQNWEVLEKLSLADNQMKAKEAVCNDLVLDYEWLAMQAESGRQHIEELIVKDRRKTAVIDQLEEELGDKATAVHEVVAEDNDEATLSLESHEALEQYEAQAAEWTR